MKNIFKLFILFSLLILPVQAKSISFTVISDAHLSADKKENKMTPSIQKLLTAVEQANSDTSDIVVFLGDNLNTSDRINLAMFSKIVNRVKKPVYVAIGNKDMSRAKGIDKKEYYRILNKFSPNRVKKLPSYKLYEDFVFIFMGGVNETITANRGYYKTAELDFLDSVLTKFKDKKVIIFQHYPVIAPKENDLKATYKAEEYLKVLNRHENVLAVVSGHFGVEDVFDQNGVKHISVGSLSQTGEYEQIKIFKNMDGSYSITERIFDVNRE